jgi:F-type H+-transporting ATPase subunit a
VALTAIFAAEGDGASFPPTVNHSFFFDAMGDGSIIASWKVTALLVIGTALLAAFFIMSARRATVVPSKLQFFVEGVYGFVRNGIAIEVMGRAGKKWAPFLATMFVFILLMNVWELIPFAMIPVNSHFVFPAAMAVMVWVIYNLEGIKKHGPLGYLKSQ